MRKNYFPNFISLTAILLFPILIFCNNKIDTISNEKQSNLIDDAWNSYQKGEYNSVKLKADSVILLSGEHGTSLFWKNWARTLKSAYYSEQGNHDDALFIAQEAINELQNNTIYRTNSDGVTRNFPLTNIYDLLGSINFQLGEKYSYEGSIELKKEKFNSALIDYTMAINALKYDNYYNSKTKTYKKILNEWSRVRCLLQLDSGSNLDLTIKEYKSSFDSLHIEESDSTRFQWGMKNYYQVWGEYLFKNERYEEAIVQFDSLINLSKRNDFFNEQIFGHVFLAKIYLKKGQNDNAKIHFTSILSILTEPKNNSYVPFEIGTIEMYKNQILPNSSTIFGLINSFDSANAQTKKLLKIYLDNIRRSLEFDSKNEKVLLLYSDWLNEQNNLFRDVLIIGLIVFALFLIVILYKINRYKDRLKQYGDSLKERTSILQENKKALEKSCIMLNKKTEELKESRGEMNHRIKNNLKIVEINLQNQLESKKIKENHLAENALIETIERIKFIRLLHKHLQTNKENDEINIKKYFNELLGYLFKACSYNGFKPSLKIELDEELYTESSHIANLGQVITELTFNALKYSPKESRFLEVIINMHDKNILELTVSNNTISPVNIEYNNETLGLNLIKKIVENKYQGTLNEDHKDQDGIFSLKAKIPQRKLNISKK